ncbi:MAG: alpha/beta fold hydrolase [Candidatus Binatia bacterium]
MKAHLLEAGRGEPVVILHGGDGEAVDWAPLMGALQDSVKTYAVDRPGFGLTERFDYQHVDLRSHAADFVTSVLDALDIHAATLVGGSMGGFFALATALAYPNRVHGLILIGMPAGLTRSGPLLMRIMCGVPGAARLFMKRFASMEGLSRQYRAMFHTDPDTLPQLYFRTRLAGMTLPGALDTWAVLLRRCAGLRGIRPEVYLGDELPKLQPPTLLIWGEHDMAPASVGHEASTRIPHGRFICLRGVGHLPFLQVPDECARLILEFIRRPVT